jgi:hypothetical protein
MKIGLLWLTAALLVVIGLVVILPNFEELWQDGSLVLYLIPCVIVASAIQYTRNQKP